MKGIPTLPVNCIPVGVTFAFPVIDAILPTDVVNCCPVAVTIVFGVIVDCPRPAVICCPFSVTATSILTLVEPIEVSIA